MLFQLIRQVLIRFAFCKPIHLLSNHCNSQLAAKQAAELCRCCRTLRLAEHKRRLLVYKPTRVVRCSQPHIWPYISTFPWCPASGLIFSHSQSCHLLKTMTFLPKVHPILVGLVIMVIAVCHTIVWYISHHNMTHFTQLCAVFTPICYLCLILHDLVTYFIPLCADFKPLYDRLQTIVWQVRFTMTTWQLLHHGVKNFTLMSHTSHHYVANFTPLYGGLTSWHSDSTCPRRATYHLGHQGAVATSCSQATVSCVWMTVQYPNRYSCWLSCWFICISFTYSCRHCYS